MDKVSPELDGPVSLRKVTLLWPAAINVAMVLGLAPVIGVPLPLFSYGGSALLSAAISIGLLLNVSMRRYVF